jgi:hypothetical protein
MGAIQREVRSEKSLREVNEIAGKVKMIDIQRVLFDN